MPDDLTGMFDWTQSNLTGQSVITEGLVDLTIALFLSLIPFNRTLFDIIIFHELNIYLYYQYNIHK